MVQRIGFAGSMIALALTMACGNSTTQKPAEEPKMTETTSAQADMPSQTVQSAEPIADAPSTKESVAKNEEAQAHSLAMMRADDFAKTFKWSETPSFGKLPESSPVGAVGDKAFIIDEVRIAIDEPRGTWDFEARGGESQVLGLSVALKGAPKSGGKYVAKMGTNRGYFQAPQVGKAISTTEFSDTISVNGENAYNIEITKLTLDKGGKTGKASGRFVSVYKAEGDYPAMWAAGQFHDAKVVITKK